LSEPTRTAVEIAITALAAYIRTQVPTLVQVLEEFPTQNLALKWPSLTVTHDSPKFTNEMPYDIFSTEPVSEDAPAIGTTFVVGQWDYKVQLDIWSRSVPERDKMFKLVFAALNPLVSPMGLSLPLADYFGLFSRFDVDSFDHVDAEQGSQRGEWRTRISLLASLKEAITQNGFAITKPIETQIEILDTNQDLST
jgi:hypothetical protein